LLPDRLAKHGPRSGEDFLFFTNDARGPAGSNVTGKGKNEHRAKWGRSRDLSGYPLQAFAINAGGFDISCKIHRCGGARQSEGRVPDVWNGRTIGSERGKR
jgi:hypothetical protein